MKKYLLAACGLSQTAFNALAASGCVSKADISSMQAVRAGITDWSGEGGTAPFESIAKAYRKHHREQQEEVKPMLDPMSKVDRARRMQPILTEMIDAVAKRDGISRSAAADKVLLSPQVSELVALEKREAELIRQQRQDEIEKSVHNQLPQQRPGHMQGSFNPAGPHGGYEPGTDVRRPARATGGPSADEDQPTIRSSDEIDWTDLKAASEAHRKERRAKYGA
jgi:hypothetical protein